MSPPLHYAHGAQSTICKCELSVADIDRGYYRDHALTIARHPSETDERMMVRLLAFALHADERLLEIRPRLEHRGRARPLASRFDLAQSSAGSTSGYRMNVTCARHAVVPARVTYWRMADARWSCGGKANAKRVERQDRLAVSEIPIEASRALAALAGRSMRLQVTIQEGHVFVADGATSVAVDLRVIKAPSLAR